MDERHLTYFKVENFKRFDSLELTDIGQFNLIVGDNNVGKTSVLEALLFDEYRENCLRNFHKVLLLKGLHLLPQKKFGTKGEIIEIKYPSENFLKYLIRDIKSGVILTVRYGFQQFLLKLKYEDFYLSFEANDKSFPEPSGISFLSEETYDEMAQRTKPVIINTSQGLYAHCLNSDIENREVPIISTSLSLSTLSKLYFDQVGLSRKVKKQLIDDMKFLLLEIEDFEVRKIGGEDQLLVGMRGVDELMPISTFGESVTRATQILLEIAKYKGRRLMIDEIDTGIHYSRMKQFLKTIFQVAEKNEVQLFMTTHSLECQQAFAEVFEDDDLVESQGKARQFSLLEKPDGNVVASVRTFEQLQHALETGFDTRGGKRAW